jgi:ribose transport system permease protein
LWIPETFLTASNFQSIVSSQAVLMILTLGTAIPIVAGEFDISIAGTMTFCMTVLGYLTVLHGWALAPALLVVLAGALVIGVVNAGLVVRVGIDSIVATLGTGTALGGLSLMLSESALISGLPQSLHTAATSKLLGLPLPVYYGLALATLMWVLYEHTALGRRLIFAGAGAEAGRLSGVKVDLVRAGSFVGSALLACFAGVVLAGQLGTADPTGGLAFLLPAVAGVFLGATAFHPGRPNAWGSVVALYFLVAGVTGLQLLGAGGWIQDVFNGVALIVGVAVVRLLSNRTGIATR